MNKTINTYDELLAYQEQLKELMVAQKQVIRYDIKELKNELRPLTNIARIVSKFFTRSKDHSMFVNGASSLIDLALKKMVLPRASMVSRMIIPFLVKNISSHLVAENKDGLLSKVLSLLTPRKKKSFRH